MPESRPLGSASIPKVAGVQASGANTRRLLADPRPLLGFFTRLPGASCASLESIVQAFPLVPVVGWVTGLIGALIALLLAPVLPPAALAAVLVVSLVGLTGLNQTDGLLDLGDGLMVHGDADRRRQVMHDPSAGVGAVGAVLFTYLLSYGALAGIAQQAGGVALFDRGSLTLAAAMVEAEVFCRLTYPVLAWRGRSSHGGLGSAFIEGFGLRHVAVSLLVAAPALLGAFWLGWPPLVLGLAAAGIVAAILLRVSGRLLGGIGGDVLGASQELARAVVLLAVSLGLGV